MTADATRPPRRSPSTSSAHESHAMLSQLFAFNRLLFAPTIWEVLETLLQQIQQILGASSCVLYLDPQEEGVLTLRALSSDPPFTLPPQIPLVNDLALWSLLRDDWIHQRFADMEAHFRQVLPLLASGEQHVLLAPLFRPSSPMPPGLLLVARDGTWDETEVLLLHDLASRLTIRLANQHLRESLEQHQLSGEFLAQLCIAPPDPRQEDLLLRQARFLGVDLSKPHVVVMASIATLKGQAGASHQIVDQVEAWLTRTFPGSLVVLQPSSELLGLLDLTHHQEKIVPLLQQVLQEIPEIARLLMGVSNAYSALRDYHQAYEEARDALAHAQQFQESRVCEVNEIGPLRFLKLQDARGVKATDPYSLTIQKLAQYDQQYNADLVYTLDVFLQAGGRFSNAARMMSAEPGKSIAVGTVRQRVERMCEITSMDLLDSTLWLNLQLAIKVHKAQG